MNSRWLQLGLVGLALILQPVPAAAQPFALPACSPQIPYFCADASFFLDGDAPVLVVSLEVCNEALQFLKTERGYVAEADVMVLLLDGKGHQVTGDTYRVKLQAWRYGQTTSMDSCRVKTLSFAAQAGKFNVDISVLDRDSRGKSTVEAVIEIPDLQQPPSISDVALLLAKEGDGQGRWPGFTPNIRHTYSDAAAGMPFYYEIYHGAEDSVNVIHRILDGQGEEVYRLDTVSVGAGTVSHLEKIPLDSIANGRYLLESSIADSQGKPRMTRSKAFDVSSEVLYLGRNLEEAVALLYYIASGSLIDAFEKGDAEERKRIWQQFWREKDPTPNTPRNEFYEEHLKRFRYANEHYGTTGAEGWRTDRGRIYITYGPPDEIESYPMEIDRDPTEIWYYYEHGRRFVFVDETGFGDYVLIR